VILARVNLPEYAAYAGFVHADDHEQILHNEAHVVQLVDDFDVREALLVGANLILTFHDVNTLRFEDTVSFLRSFEVQVEDGIVIFLRRVLRAVAVFLGDTAGALS